MRTRSALATRISAGLCDRPNIWGNEKADELAKLGTVSDNEDEGYVPLSLVKRRVSEHVASLCSAEWEANAPRHPKLILNCNKDIPKQLKKLENNRQDYRNIVQIITGRAGVNHTLHMMKVVDTKECPNCGHEDETVSHYLGQCPMYARRPYQR